jgi:hypothetical protein
MIQDLIVYAVVAGAVAYLVKHWFLTSKGEKGCGGCGGCAASKPKEEKLVQIDLGGSFRP